jgi:hypothetical protein
LKRYLYYCRDKRGTSRKTRIRSCEACVKAKTRCDGARPSCARCVARNVSCVYSIQRAKSISRVSTGMNSTCRPEDDSGTTLVNGTSQPLVLQETAEYVEATDIFPGPVSTPSSFGLPDWGLPHGELSFENEWGPVLLPMPLQGQRDAWTDQTFIARRSDPQIIPRMPDYHLRSFGQSQSITTRTSPSATLMTHILTSFPKMMYSPGSLPPFIHPYSLGNNSHNSEEGFESLVTCATLMQMLSSGAPGTRRLFWKNVRLECERLQIEVHTTFPDS